MQDERRVKYVTADDEYPDDENQHRQIHDVSKINVPSHTTAHNRPNNENKQQNCAAKILICSCVTGSRKKTYLHKEVNADEWFRWEWYKFQAQNI